MTHPVESVRSVASASLEFSLDDAKVRCELRVVAFHAGDELVGVLAADERLDGVAERVVEARAEVDDGKTSNGGRLLQLAALHRAQTCRGARCSRGPRGVPRWSLRVCDRRPSANPQDPREAERRDQRRRSGANADRPPVERAAVTRDHDGP
jgi:hypothetical protein